MKKLLFMIWAALALMMVTSCTEKETYDLQSVH